MLYVRYCNKICETIAYSDSTNFVTDADCEIQIFPRLNFTNNAELCAMAIHEIFTSFWL